MVLGTRVPGRVGRRRFFSESRLRAALCRSAGLGSPVSGDATAGTGRRPAFEIATARGEIGARRPTLDSRGRCAARGGARQRCARAASTPARSAFAAYSSFAYPFGAIAALPCAPALLPRRWRALRRRSGLAAALLLARAASSTRRSPTLSPGARAATWSRRSSRAARRARTALPGRAPRHLAQRAPRSIPASRRMPAAADHRPVGRRPASAWPSRCLRAGAPGRRLVGAATGRMSTAGWPCSPSASCAARTCPGANDNASGVAWSSSSPARCAARAARVHPSRRPDHRLRGVRPARRAGVPRRPLDRGLAVPQLRQRRRPRDPALPAPRRGSAAPGRPTPDSSRSPSASARSTLSSASQRSTRRSASPTTPRPCSPRGGRATHLRRRRSRPDPQLPPAHATRSRTSTATGWRGRSRSGAS